VFPTKQISLRVGLGLAVGLLVTVVVGAVSGITFYNTRAAILEQTNERVDALLRELSGRVAAHMAAAVPSIELARTMLRDSLVRDDADALARQFTLVLRNNPSFSWMSYSDESGNFTGAYRASDGTFHVSQSTVAGGGELHEYLVGANGDWTPTIRQSNYGYDPRTDRFYGPAARAGTRVWVGPYVFFDEGVPGITAASPYADATGALRGVFTVDFNLNALSRFVEALPFGRNGRVFILTPDGTMIAHPTLRLVQVTGQGSRGSLVTVANVGDRVIPEWFEAWKRQASQSAGTHFTFDVERERYIGAGRTVEFDRNVSWVLGAAAPESDFLGLLARNRIVALVVLALGLLFGVLVSLVLARRVSAPLASLATEMGHVGDFVLTDRPRLRTRFREVALMDRSLLAMKGSLRSFAYFVPTDLVRTLLASGQEARLEGHTEELTVCFADIAGFTSMAESVSPDELVRRLARYLDEVTGVIRGSGGTIDKFIGDAVMAFWGAPRPAPDHAARASEAAIRIQRALASARASAGTSWLAGLYARVGVASGDVLVGNVGTPSRFNYTVMGDTVNLASRLEGLNKVYGTPILVSEATFTAARARIVARPVDLVQVKGKQLGVTVYEPLCLSEDDDPQARQVASLSEEAFTAYRARHFQSAADCFARVLSIRPNDRAASVLEARCRAYLASPPPPGWTGVHVATEK